MLKLALEMLHIVVLILQALKWTRHIPVVGTSITRSYATEGKLAVS